jgi:hypothetical protein
MTYRLTKFDATGRQIADLGQFNSVIAARNAMIENAGWEPTELPFHCPELRIVEGWFAGSAEYNIELQ